MTRVAKLFTIDGDQAILLPEEFRFPGKKVWLRRTKSGAIEILPEGSEVLRSRLMKLAGSCPDLPFVEPHKTADVPRDFS